MSLIVALFLGLTVSAEEIFRDRKILKREAFLNLSRTSYLFSKVSILFAISAIQTLSFVLIANTILGLKDMYFSYWLALFSTAAFANMLGLNVSASFNSAVTIYILIPLLMIPMMILSGAMFSFDKLNRNVGSVDKVPLMAEFMVTKWSYEALMVHQFKDNKFEQPFYELEKQKSIADFKQVYTIPELQKRLDACQEEFKETGKISKTVNQLQLLQNEFTKELVLNPGLPFHSTDGIVPDQFDAKMAMALQAFINKISDNYSKQFGAAEQELQKKINRELKKDPKRYSYYKDTYLNDNLGDFVKKALEKNKILEYDNELIQNYHPIYMDPTINNVLSWRSHFFAPRKAFLGKYYDTYWYNIIVIWLITIVLYITLYFESLKKGLDLLGKIKLKKENSD
jgi:ABC transport system ATP-binding/permease protein